MFLALRDIRFARGRFALMTGVVALVTLLLVLLSALTRGLGLQSTSAVSSLPAGRVLLAPSGSQTSWADSVVTTGQRDTLRRAGVVSEPLGIGHVRAERGADSTTVALFGVAPGGRAAVTPAAPARDDEVVLAQDTAEQLGLHPGEQVTLGGDRLTVTAVEPTRWYSHSAVAWTTLATQQRLAHVADGQVTALLSDDAAGADAAAGGAGLVSLAPGESLSALPGYSSERGSLLMIQGFLYGICALVVMAFLSVWTIQRTRDIAVVRALGGTRRHVLADQLGQAAVLLLAGTAAGGLTGTAVARAVTGTVPVQVALATTLLPAVGVALVGLVGAVLATRRVTRVDPLLALGGN